jgi:predicted small integral membrane protein
MTATRWTSLYATIIAVMAAFLAFLIWAVPRDETGFLWFDPMIKGGWMAWSFPIALFFYVIASLLILMTLLAIRFPETPRRGVLRIETTRGDRLFITLLGSAFINLAWLFAFGAPLTWALIVCLIYAVAVFRWV